MKEIRPQAGPQEDFMTTSADIAIFGGAAGGGKSYALLMEGARHIDNKKFGGVIFRRESKQITSEGGLWDTAMDIYPSLGATFVQSPLHTAKFPKGSKLSFSHMQLLKHMFQWDGSQIPFIGWDELQHFLEQMFWYMFSRNRSTCGVRPYIRATCNPNPDSFLVKLLAWWIHQEDDPDGNYIAGDPNKERSGIIRWFVRIDGTVHWEDSREELINKFPKSRPKSFTFIMSSLADNPALLEADPDYEGNIEALLDYEKKRLKGNWFARPTAGELFKRQYFGLVDEIVESDIMQTIRYWDRAATEPNEENTDPDWSAGVLMHLMVDNTIIVADVSRDRLDPGDVEALIDYSVQSDSDMTVLGLEQEPGASGKFEVNYYVEKYTFVEVEVFPKTKSKLTCWTPAARAAKKGRIKMLKAPWNQAFINEAESVTDGTQAGHDDQMDAFAGGYNYLTGDNYSMEAVKVV